MKYLCLIYLSGKELEFDAQHLDFNDGLRRSGQLIEAEALERFGATACVHVRNGKIGVTDGPFAAAREPVAGYYVIEARDLNEAIQVAAKIPSAPLATIEVRTARQTRRTA